MRIIARKIVAVLIALDIIFILLLFWFAFGRALYELAPR